MILTALALVVAGSAPADWLLVRGEPDRVLTLSYERIGDLYLGGEPYEVVTPARAAKRVEASRLVIGTPANNALIAELADTVGIATEEDALVYAGRRIERSQGLVIATDDPDGAGRLVVFTGVDEPGVFSCFTTSISVQNAGWHHTAKNTLLARGELPMRFDTSAPRVVRLDELLETLALQAKDEKADERGLSIGLGLVGYADVLAQVGVSGDLVHYGRWVTGAGRPVLERVARYFGERDLDRATRDAHAACAKLLGPIEGPQPAYYFVHSYPNATNARNFGDDGLTGRRRIVFNLPALARGRHLDVALIHETIHAHQDLSGTTLAERAVIEGVATLLTQVIDPTISDVDALFWSDEELHAARERHDAIVTAFRSVQSSRDPESLRGFTQLGAPLERVPGAPSRTAYYVGWAASRAWLEADAGRGPADLLVASAQEILAAL